MSQILQHVPGILNIRCNKNDDVNFSVTFSDMSLSGYTFEAEVEHSAGTTPMTVTVTDSAHGVVTVSLAQALNITLPAGAKKWSLRWTTGGATRTILSGEYAHI